MANLTTSARRDGDEYVGSRVRVSVRISVRDRNRVPNPSHNPNPNPNSYIVNGSKCFITSRVRADLTLTLTLA